MAEKKKKKKIKINSRFALIILVVFALIIVFAGRNTANTVTVTADSVESTVMGEGLLTYKEEVHYAEAPGEVLYSYSDGTRVLQGKKIATHYSGEMDDETKEQLRVANEKLSQFELQSAYKNVVTDDVSTLKKERKKTIAEIAVNSSEGNYSEVGKLKSELEIYNAKILEIESGVTAINEVENARNSILDIESKLVGSKQDYYSHQSGIFSNHIDGLENVLTPDTANTLTVDRYKEMTKILEKYAPDDSEKKAICKIINNYEWYITSLVNYEDVKEIKPGEESANVGLRITSKSDDSVDGVVTYISQPDKDGMSVITVKSTKYVEDIFETRRIAFEIIKNEYKGLKVPLDSIFEKDGKRGVLAVKDSVARFVPLEILYEDKSYAIVKNGSTVVGSDITELVLYDLVIQNYSRIGEGTIVK